MPEKERHHPERPLERWVLGGAILGSLCLALQMTHPLSGVETAPNWLNSVCSTLLLLGLFRFVLWGRKDEKWLAFVILLWMLLFLGTVQPWSAESSGIFVTRSCRLLSTTHFGVPLIALGATWAQLGLGLLCGRGVLVCFSSAGPWERGTAWLVGLVVALFGAHGVIGYASGNSSLVIP